MKTVILSGDFTGEKTLPTPGFEPMTSPTEFLFAAAIPILSVKGLLMLSPKEGLSSCHCPGGYLAVADKQSRLKSGLSHCLYIKKK